METATIESPESSLGNLREKAECDYKAAVFAAACGENIDVAELRATLWPLSRSLDDFEKHVEIAKNRIESAAKLKEGDALVSDIAAAKTTRDEAAESLRAVGEEANRSIQEARTTWEAADAHHVQLVHQQRNLRGVADNLAGSADPELAKAIADLDNQRCQLGHLVQAGKEASVVIARDREKIGRLEEMKTAGGTWPAPDPRSLELEIAAIEREWAGPRERVERGEQAVAEIDAIDAEIDALRQRQHDPLIGMSWEI